MPPEIDDVIDEPSLFKMLMITKTTPMTQQNAENRVEGNLSNSSDHSFATSPFQETFMSFAARGGTIATWAMPLGIY